MAKDKALNRSHAITMILAVLKDGARHGYDITREVERRSANEISFNDGTLYPVLHGLEKDGYIASEWVELPGERPRRVYVLCDAGAAELERQVSAWRNFSRAVENVIENEVSWSALFSVGGWNGRR